ncbi:MAG: Smr/MutS family protein [Bacteroidales bacterium]|jgi:DNA mismatch repair protein MutS2|nr:Smr/MutS family protein [Bacteroidales bacterium]
MIFPSNFEQKLGFDTIRQMLSEYCLSSLGRNRVEQIAFSTDAEEIRTMLSQTAEMKQIVQFEGHFPAQDYYDMIPALLDIRIPGSYLEPEQLSELRLSLITISGLYDFLETHAETYPSLSQLIQHPVSSIQYPASSIQHPVSSIQYPASSIQYPVSSIQHPASLISDLLPQIDKIVNEKSAVRDSASPELQRIRKEKASKQSGVERQVVQCFKQARHSGWTPDDAEITIRNGRLVIPLVSTHKRKIPGFIHDESATGHTVYVEPAEIFETNNEIRELEYAEHREIIQILIKFADLLRPGIDELLQGYQFLGKIDFIRAKARLAVEVNGWKPMITMRSEIGDKKSSIQNLASSIGSEATSHPASSIQDLSSSIRSEATPHPASCILHREQSELISERSEPALLWRSAVHPLLYLSHRKQNRPVVPLDIELNSAQRILIISGPNAGGKSVCLKTVGLLQYMFQCGLLPPVKEDSEFSVFSRIFIDIGDEQSIDNDLSTYTSKLLNLKYFIEHLDVSSLFLIDELGTGTDPSLGGAIAEATLESLNNVGAFGVVTTHYSNLKLLAGREPGIVNGAMLFDLKKLKPLYQLKTGKPGSSFALEIAHEIGFPEEVLNKARKKTGKSQLDFDRELQNLEVEKQEINKKESELKVADDFLAELIKKYEKIITDLENNKKDILEKARNEAQQLLDNSNKIIEKTIKEIREAQAEKSITKVAREKLSKDKKALKEDAGYKIQDPGYRIQDTGYKIKDTGSHILHPASRIVSGANSSANEVSPSSGANSHPASWILDPASDTGYKKSPYHSYLADLQQRSDQFSLTLDLRGKRVDEALALLQRYIDDAILLSIHEVRILHGKGNGVLRQVTRDYLRSQREVKSARDAALESGGTGITEVTFR